MSRTEDSVISQRLQKEPLQDLQSGQKPERALVLDLTTKSSKVKKIVDMEELDHGNKIQLSFQIPQATRTQRDCWDIWQDQDDAKNVRAAEPLQNLNGSWDFIGRLDLQNLTYFDKLRRRKGKLSHVYVVAGVVA